MTVTDFDLLYAATGRCQCGAGLAHPQDHEAAMQLRAWVCSKVLKGEAELSDGHERLSFALYKVREENSINNMGGHTTRPAGTVCKRWRSLLSSAATEDGWLTRQSVTGVRCA